MWRCRRYIRFVRRIVSAGCPASSPISKGYADICWPHPAGVRSLLAMFARQACDRTARRLDFAAKAAVAKLQCARDTLIGLLIRGSNEHATDRRRGAQQPDTRRG